MRHSLASRLDEYCSLDNTTLPGLSGAAKSCPESDEYACPSGNASVTTAILPEPPDDVCASLNNPKVGCSAHRRRPASAERRVCEYRWPGADRDLHLDANCNLVVAESPTDQTRRKLLLAHSEPDSSHTAESVFFSLKSWVVAFFPRFSPPEFDLGFVQDSSNSLDANRINDTFFDNILSKFCQRPASKWLTEQVRRAQGGFNNKASLLFGEFGWSARVGFGFEGFQPVGIELLDDGADVLGREIESSGNLRHFRTLFRGQDDLGTAYLDTVATGADNVLKFFAFRQAEIADVQTHGNPP